MIRDIVGNVRAHVGHEDALEWYGARELKERLGASEEGNHLRRELTRIYGVGYTFPGRPSLSNMLTMAYC